MSEDSVNYALGVDCEAVRMSYNCPNRRKCKNVFDRDVGPTILNRLRKSIWDPGVGKDERGNEKRRERLLQVLRSMIVLGDSGKEDIVFKLNGIPVCKHFFKV